jgi:hypothetical protein
MLEVITPEKLPVPQARAGDFAAWDTLFRRYQMPLYVYLFELTRDEQASLDLVQETFIAAVKHIFWLLLWSELVLPSRRTWAGIAAAWVLILVVNFALRDPAPAGKTMVPAPAMMSFQEQQRLINELLADRAQPRDADRPKTVQLGPRSGRSVMSMT